MTRCNVENNLGTVKIPGYSDLMSSRDSYHHGDLKAAILAEAAALVADRGADGLSLRELARAAGVSHAAPAHHFTDRRGLFTALATEGFACWPARSPAPGRTSWTLRWRTSGSPSTIPATTR